MEDGAGTGTTWKLSGTMVVEGCVTGGQGGGREAPEAPVPLPGPSALNGLYTNQLIESSPGC